MREQLRHKHRHKDDDRAPVALEGEVLREVLRGHDDERIVEKDPGHHGKAVRDQQIRPGIQEEVNERGTDRDKVEDRKRRRRIHAVPDAGDKQHEHERDEHQLP